MFIFPVVKIPTLPSVGPSSTESELFTYNQTRTRRARIPQIVACGAVGYVENLCDTFNNTLCGFDRPYYRPVCVSDDSINGPCAIPDGKVQVQLRLQSQSVNNTASRTYRFGIYSEANACFSGNYVGVVLEWEVLVPAGTTLDETLWAAALTNLHPGYITVIPRGTGDYTLLLDEAYFTRYFGVNPTFQTLKSCSSFPVSSQGYDILILEQPRSCNNQAPPPCDFNGFIKFQFSAVPNVGTRSVSIAFGDASCRVNFLTFETVSPVLPITQNVLDASILSQYSSFSPAISVSSLGPGRYEMLVSIQWLRMYYPELVGTDVCNMGISPCIVAGATVQILEQITCCTEAQGPSDSNTCYTLPGFARLVYEVENSLTYTYGAGTDSKIFISWGGGPTGDPAVVPYDQPEFNFSNATDYDSYMNNHLSYWTRTLEVGGNGFARRVGSRIEVYYRIANFGQQVCTTAINIMAPKRSSNVPTFVNTFDILVRVVGDSNPLDTTPFNNPNLVGTTTLPCCETVSAITATCCPCSENAMCNLAAKVARALQSYVQITGDIPSGTSDAAILTQLIDFSRANMLPEDQLPANLTVDDGESGCRFIQFVKHVQRVLNPLTGREVSVATVEMRMIPKLNCNYSYAASIANLFSLGVPFSNPGIFRSIDQGIFVPNPYITVSILFGGNVTFNVPAGFTEAPEDCGIDEPCNESGLCDVCAPCTPRPICTGTDLLYFQFRMLDLINNWSGTPNAGWSADTSGSWLASVEVISPGCPQIPFGQYVREHYVGINQKATEVRADGGYVQNIVIDPTFLPNEFKFKFTFNMGGNRQTVFYSEDYRKVECGESTILIEGLYPPNRIDCEGWYYGLPLSSFGTGVFEYRHITRIRGSFNLVGFDVENEIQNNKVVSTKTKKRYRLITEALPLDVVTRLLSAFSAQNVVINGGIFQVTGAIDKDNENGRMWHIDATFSQEPNNPECIEQDFTCG